MLPSSIPYAQCCLRRLKTVSESRVSMGGRRWPQLSDQAATESQGRWLHLGSHVRLCGLSLAAKQQKERGKTSRDSKWSRHC